MGQNRLTLLFKYQIGLNIENMNELKNIRTKETFKLRAEIAELKMKDFKLVHQMKIYQTNAALGYRQLAFLIRLDKSANGHNYLCIGTQNINDNEMYQIGKIVEDLEDFYLEDTTFKITDSELNGTYLFDYWVSHYCA